MKVQEGNKIVLKRKKGNFGYVLPEGKGKPRWTQLRVMKNEETGQEFTVGLADGSLEPIVEANGKYYWISWQGICELAEKEGILGSVEK